MGDEKKSCWSGMVYSFFVGALLGAGLSFIFSPVSGKKHGRLSRTNSTI